MNDPKYGAKGTIEPEIFAIWFTPIFIEVFKKAPTQSEKQLQVLTKKIPHIKFSGLIGGHLQ